jgi:ABC-type molybdate transport system substrate-binding protein
MVMRKLGVLVMFIAVLWGVISSFAFAGSTKEITVSAAISLKNAF